jgi:hypothetical protein
VHVEAQDLAQQGRRILGRPELVVASTPVAHGDVQQPVGPEHDAAAVVVGAWLRDEAALGVVVEAQVDT